MSSWSPQIGGFCLSLIGLYGFLSLLCVVDKPVTLFGSFPLPPNVSYIHVDAVSAMLTGLELPGLTRLEKH